MTTICFIVQGLRIENRYLQPWRYLHEAAGQLSRLGHVVTLVTDGTQDWARLPDQCMQVINLPSVRNFLWSRNVSLMQTIRRIDPRVIVWGLGVTSFLHQAIPKEAGRIQLGVFSSPIYTLLDLYRLGIFRLLSNLDLAGTHLLGALTPPGLLKYRSHRLNMRVIVTQTRTTADHFRQRIGSLPVAVIPPGVDEAWFAPEENSSPLQPANPGQMRIGYLGAPDRLRGLPTLLRAFARARKTKSGLHLTILNRGQGRSHSRKTKAIRNLIQRLGVGESITLVDGSLGQNELIAQCRTFDAIALPFELLPSDAPLAIYETIALGKVLITTRTGCLPEIAVGRQTYLAAPADVATLQAALIQSVSRESTAGCSPRTSRIVWRRTWDQVGLDWNRLIESLESGEDGP